MAEKRLRTKYPGVYFSVVPTLAGKATEKKFYIMYRRGGRGSAQVCELLGTESEGWTEKRAHDERLRRKAGDAKSNAERREAALTERKARETGATYAEIWEAYMAYGKGRRTDKSLRNDANLHGQHLSASLGGMPVDRIRTADISQLRRKAESQGLAPKTVKNILGQVRRVLRWGAKHGLCRMPEGLLFDMPRVDNQKTETMTDAQLAAYMKALDEERDQVGAAALRPALATGMRKAAILALRWDDIDLERRLLTLRGENAKNGKTAILPMNDLAAEIIGKLPRDGEYLFPGRFSGHREGVGRMARRVRDKAGLKDFRPMHGLRHVFASTLASNGVDLYTLQALLTHGSPAMTQRYAHLSNEHLRNAANVANRLTKKDGEGEKEEKEE